MIIHRSHALTQSCAHVQRIMMNQTMHFFVIQSYSYSLCIFMCTYTIQHDINVFQFINSIKVCISLGMNKHHCQRYVIVNIVHYPMCVGTFKLFFCFLSASNNNNNNNQRKKNRKTNNENKLGKKSCKHALAQKKKATKMKKETHITRYAAWLFLFNIMYHCYTTVHVIESNQNFAFSSLLFAYVRFTYCACVFVHLNGGLRFSPIYYIENVCLCRLFSMSIFQSEF